MLRALVCLCIAGGVARAQVSFLETRVEQGVVRGFRDAPGEVFAFYNIPYARAPTGPDRFKAPLPPTPFGNVFYATNRATFCPQPFVPFTLNEDCLVANIFMPDTHDNNLPVLVYVHGGAYYMGTGLLLPLTEFAKKHNVIVVNFNYRLGVHGFLCLGTENVPGNAGMKDQVALLRWVKRNIANFLGNPDDITIAGCSAGGGSVDLLTLSPMAEGLFTKVITGSGACMGALGAQMDPIENAKTYAKGLNFDQTDDLEALENFYRTLPIDTLVSNVNAMVKGNGELMFSPCVEVDTGSDEERFLTDTPYNILKNGSYTKYPLLYGYTDLEGQLKMSTFEAAKEPMNENFSDFLPSDIEFESQEKKEEVAKDVKEFYFGDKPVGEETVRGFVDYYTDILFAYPMLSGLKMRMQSIKDTVYLYEYSFVDENTPYLEHTTDRGAQHCAQDIAVMDEDTTNATSEYVEMKDMMRQMWYNFMVSGEPVPEGSTLPAWPAVSDTWKPYMALKYGSEATTGPFILEERMQFWDRIYENSYLKPRPPIITTPSAAAYHAFSHALLLLLSCVSVIVAFNYS